jgi:hypothetical protein
LQISNFLSDGRFLAMSPQAWTLLDTEQGVYLDEFALAPGDVPGSPEGWRATKRTLRGGLQDGVDVVEVDNGRLRFALLPTRGMGLWRCWMDGQTLGWRSPVRGPVHPKFVPLAEPGGLGWLSGFDELLVRCGLESNGAPEFDEPGRLKYPLHGRIANLPAHRVTVSFDAETQELAVTGVVEESRFHFQKLRLTATYRTRLGEASLTVRDEVENYSAEPGAMQLLYHINIGQPLHGPGGQFVAPIIEGAPRDAEAAAEVERWNAYGPEQPGQAERVFFLKLRGDAQGDTLALLKNPAGDAGVCLRFNTRQLPCFALWKNTPAAADGYVTGMEPATNFPNPRSFEGAQGRVVKRAPGGKHVGELRLDWLTAADELAAAEREIAQLQRGGEPRMHARPQPGWCAEA